MFGRLQPDAFRRSDLVAVGEQLLDILLVVDPWKDQDRDEETGENQLDDEAFEVAPKECR